MPTPSIARSRRREHVPTRRSWRHVALGLATLLLAACGGGGGDGPTNPNPNPNPNPTPGTLAVALNSNSGSVVAGNQVAVAVTVTRGGSFTGAVTLEATGAPAGVTVAFSTTSLAAGVTAATFTASTTGATAPGTYPITVRASGTGVTAATAVYNLTVTAAPVPTVSIEVSNNDLTLPAGESRQVDVTITRGGGFAGPVSLAVTGLPAGVTATIPTNPVAGTTGTVTLTAAAGAAPATVTLTVRGTATGVTDATASIALTVTGPQRLTLETATPAVTIVQGAQSPGLPITITRENITGNVALSVTAPTGITATVTPNPATGASASVVIAVAASVAPGQVPVVITGLLGSRSASVTFQVTVIAAAAPDYGLSLSPPALTLTAGQSISTTVNVTRSGGFTGAVTLGTSALPAGVTATFTPTSVTGTSAQLQLQSSGSTPAGTYQISVLGTATGIAARQTNLTLVVQAPSGGTGNVTWQFCEADRFPLWFAFQDGTSGAWTRVLPGASQTYSFTMNSTRGAVAFVNRESGSNADVLVFQLTREELQQLGQAECVTNPAVKTLNGTVAGLGIAQQASVGVGGGSVSSLAANGPFTVNDVNDGPVDLVAVRTAVDLGTFALTPDRLILRRGLNLPNNGTIPVLDFGAAEAFAPASAPITVANAGGDQVVITNAFVTQGGGFTGTLFTAITGGATRTLYGVPTARTQNGDLHQLSVIAVNGTTSQRAVFQYNRELVARTITLGPQLTTPTVSSLGSAPYPRLRAAATFQAEYGQGVGVTYTQTSGGGRSWTVTASPAYFAGATAYQLDMPDLTSASGFDLSWALVSGVSTTWSVSASKVEDAPIGPFVENFRAMQASRTGTTTP
jgi:hypothetical protein